MKPQRKRRFKSQLFGVFAQIGKALASPHRLQIIEVLAQREHTVEELAADIHLPVANVSQHLQVLRRARLVKVRREGLYAHYTLADERVFQLWRALRELGCAQLTELDDIVTTFLGQRRSFDAVTLDELLQRIERDEVIVLDVRPQAEYDAGHIAKARSIPFDELLDRLAELPKDVEVVAYCRGPYCVFADGALTALRAAGFRAKRLTEGYPDWRARGFPTAVTVGR